MDPQFKFYVVCSVVLSLQALFLGALTASRRSKVKRLLNPEDSAVAFDKEAAYVEGQEHPEVARIMRVHRNLLESLPLFYALGFIGVFTAASPLGVKICMGVFTGARIAHSIVYLNGLQPWRTIAFGLGVLSLIGLSVLSLMAVFA